MGEHRDHNFTAFEGDKRVASGSLADVAARTKAIVDRGGDNPVFIFNDATAEIIELDLRGTVDDVLKKVSERAKSGAPADGASCTEKTPSKSPGRPKLGVVGREVTLLPRHWDWLRRQPGGASVALRKLVDQARRANENGDRKRVAQAAAYRFMHAMAGNEPGFEEAARALFADDAERFGAMTERWPCDVRVYAQKLAAAAF